MKVLLAVLVGAALGVTCGVFALIAVNVTASYSVEPKTFSPAASSSETVAQTTTPVPSITLGLRTPTRAPTVGVEIVPLQPTTSLRGLKHDYQRWNNCGPTTLGMNLSYFGRADTQTDIAAYAKPNPNDHNVRPDELLAYAKRVGMRAIIRENGTLDLLKSLLSNGLPVMVETALMREPQGWIGHYRLLIGYDSRQFVAMDSLDGPSVKVSFADLDAGWRAFNRLYLMVYSDEQSARVRSILGDALDDRTMYTQAAARARAEIEANPKDAFAQFNLGTSLVGLKRADEAAKAFDRARALGLPWRMMWYQFGPFEAYVQAGRYAEVIALADSLLRVTDDLEEAHYYKGLALRGLGRESDARLEFHAALRNNPNNALARRALEP